MVKEKTIRNFLRTRGAKIVDKAGRPVTLKGVNLGGWLMMEGYILQSPNRAEQLFKKNFAVVLGKDALQAFEKDFRNHFILESDIQRIAGYGFNCIRLPFNSRLIEEKPYQYSKEGLSYLKKVIAWGKKHKVWIILDLHAGCGAQNHDWHSDSLGSADLWTKKNLQKRTIALWEFLADRFKDEEGIAGYDLLNESVIHDARALNSFYERLIKAIRGIDRRHILFVEGNRWAQDLDCLEDFHDDHLSLSVHCYAPLEFTCNLIPHLQYPLKSKNGGWDKARMHRFLSGYQKISQERGRPLYVGEFGVAARGGFYGEDQWLKDMLDCFKEFGFHWTYWTYKAVKNSIFPDGILSFFDNPAWVNRAGPLTGWETYPLHWKKKRKEMIRSWQTDGFRENEAILEVLKNAA